MRAALTFVLGALAAGGAYLLFVHVAGGPVWVGWMVAFGTGWFVGELMPPTASPVPRAGADASSSSPPDE